MANLPGTPRRGAVGKADLAALMLAHHALGGVRALSKVILVYRKFTSLRQKQGTVTSFPEPLAALGSGKLFAHT